MAVTDGFPGNFDTVKSDERRGTGLVVEAPEVEPALDPGEDGARPQEEKGRRLPRGGMEGDLDRRGVDAAHGRRCGDCPRSGKPQSH